MSNFNHKPTNKGGRTFKTVTAELNTTIKRSGSPSYATLKSVKGSFKSTSIKLSTKYSGKNELQNNINLNSKLQKVADRREIINRISDWTGGKEQAVEWYRLQPLPSFGGVTAEALVKDGKAYAVHSFLDRIENGGFA